MASPDKTAAPPNRLFPGGDAGARRARSLDKGDVPAALLDRYLVERDRQGRPERYYRDHRAREPMFQDKGRSLVARQSYPDTVADMLKVAEHRGWSSLRVAGDDAFRREVWVQAQALGLEVKGHRPTERDRAAAAPAGREQGPPAADRDRSPERKPASRTVEARLAMAAQVVRAMVVDPEMQARLIARAWTRAAPYLERSRDAQDRPSRGGRDR
ncbi:LPD7 domain-containing protein [Brevundimonas sp.]|uniref:LPD7 domain-containing protein n=1 Tax=Brevundimonas sp. TaxID=1871086 RepID=UPI000DB21C7C|nr:LPD7 domain-containing protein [Brevundimonas sp.]PZU72183.1 MAG: hypothetical protein DI531_13985 [Brevundimonas sp.]